METVLRWVKASELTIDYNEEYIANWHKQLVNNGIFLEDRFQFDAAQYGDVHKKDFDNLYILQAKPPIDKSREEVGNLINEAAIKYSTKLWRGNKFKDWDQKDPAKKKHFIDGANFVLKHFQASQTPIDKGNNKSPL